MPKHRVFKVAQKSRAVLQVLTGQKSAAQVCRELQIRENLLSHWKKQFVEQANLVFEKESGSASDEGRVAELERLIASGLPGQTLVRLAGVAAQQLVFQSNCCATKRLCNEP